MAAQRARTQASRRLRYRWCIRQTKVSNALAPDVVEPTSGSIIFGHSKTEIGPDPRPSHAPEIRFWRRHSAARIMGTRRPTIGAQPLSVDFQGAGAASPLRRKPRPASRGRVRAPRRRPHPGTNHGLLLSVIREGCRRCTHTQRVRQAHHTQGRRLRARTQVGERRQPGLVG